MKAYRLIGETGTFKLYAHSFLDAGARWKGDTEFYAIGKLETIEELISEKVIRYGKPKPKRPPVEKSSKRELPKPKLRVTFSF